MNMNDYKNAVSRMHVKSELKTEIIDASVEKNKKKFSEKIIPVVVASTICLSTFTVIFAVAGVFRKTNNLETQINVAQSIPRESISAAVDENKATSVITPKAVLKKWDNYYLFGIFNDGKEPNDDYQLQYGAGFLSWEYNDYYDYSYAMTVSVFNNSDYDENIDDIVFKDDEIDGLDKSGCAALADSYMEKLDIPVQGRQIYALDREVLIKSDTSRNEYGERMDIFGDYNVLPEWTEDQEAYLIVYDPCIENIPLLGYDNEYEVVIGRNGLAYFKANYVYEITEADESYDICSADKAFKSACTYYNNNGLPSDSLNISLDEIKEYHIAYIPELIEPDSESTEGEGIYEEDLKYTLWPYWVFYSEEFSDWLVNLTGDMTYNNYPFVVDATTGEFDIDKNIKTINID